MGNCRLPCFSDCYIICMLIFWFVFSFVSPKFSFIPFSCLRFRGVPSSFLLARPFWLVLGVFIDVFFLFRALVLLASICLLSSFSVIISLQFWYFILLSRTRYSFCFCLFSFAIISFSVFRLLAYAYCTCRTQYDDIANLLTSAASCY